MKPQETVAQNVEQQEQKAASQVPEVKISEPEAQEEVTDKTEGITVNEVPAAVEKIVEPEVKEVPVIEEQNNAEPAVAEVPAVEEEKVVTEPEVKEVPVIEEQKVVTEPEVADVSVTEEQKTAEPVVTDEKTEEAGELELF